ncbi:phosphodiesterase DibA [Pseudomonas sp. MWU16-30317]|uniref:phosphodiesterase DibA n=1 Tax=Pseudomonas sp. MWU16-30317 TaxID=2878095 RepID=UPI001CF9A3B2|nr:GGDEF and EAL domain-containing protein [Pseudomonas sp. MWU16-30317]
MAVPSRNALRVALSYLALSVLWYVLTDQILSRFFDDSVQIAHGQMISGYFWIVLSALVLLFARSRLLRDLAAEGSQRRAEQDRLRMAAAVFDSTLEGVLVTNAQGQIVHVNRAFMDITGYCAEEVIGCNPSKFKSGRHDPAFYHQLFADLDAKGEWHGEIWNRRKSGEVYPQWQTIRVIRTPRGAITHYVAVFSDVSASKRSAQELTRLAHHDPLTELPNRLLFSDRVEQSLSAARAHKRVCALLFIDLDHFQSVNDGLGHAAGDRLLKAVAQRLEALMGESMTLARLGGDEFAVLIESCVQVAQAAEVAQRLANALKEPFTLDQQTLFVGASVGISLFPDDASSAEQLLRNADSALFKAKNSGRGGYALYTEALTAHARQRLEVGAELRRALQQEELRVYYQPVHDLGSGAMVGVEALVRWMHPQRGLVPPIEFIPVAEDSGLIVDIDRWVTRQACEQMVAWQAQGRALAFVAVNLSSRLFGHADLNAGFAQVLDSTGLDPALLEVEVTESAVMDDPDRALEQLHSLRALGLRLAIDDFGTGYSSLLRLKRLPVHKLKIDQGFVAGLPDDEDDIAIVRAIIALAHSMGLQVHAEGIEQPEQGEFLRRHGCELGQGYGFGRPVPPEQLQWAQAL